MSLTRTYSSTSQRHLTVTEIRRRLGWSDPSCRGYWQDLRDSAQEFRIAHFSDGRWGDINDNEKQRLCALFRDRSPHKPIIEREEDLDGNPFICWWLLANTRAVRIQAGGTYPGGKQSMPPPPPRAYYDPVRG